MELDQRLVRSTIKSIRSKDLLLPNMGVDVKDQINFIRGKCTKANPEIVALKFGCEVEAGLTGLYTIVSGPTQRYAKSEKGAYHASRHKNDEINHGRYFLDATEIGTIHGRPIRLADGVQPFDLDQMMEMGMEVHDAAHYRAHYRRRRVSLLR